MRKQTLSCSWFYKLFVSLQWKCTGQRVCFERFEKVKLKFRTAQNTTRFSVLGSQPDVNKAHTNDLRHRYATPKTELFQFLEPQFLFLLTVVFKKQKRFFRCLFRKKTVTTFGSRRVFRTLQQTKVLENNCFEDQEVFTEVEPTSCNRVCTTSVFAGGTFLCLPASTCPHLSLSSTVRRTVRPTTDF